MIKGKVYFSSQYFNLMVIAMPFFVIALLYFRFSDPLFGSLLINDLATSFLFLAWVFRLIVIKKPMVSLTDREFIYTPSLFSKKIIAIQDIKSVEVEGKYLYFNLKLVIKYMMGDKVKTLNITPA